MAQIQTTYGMGFVALVCLIGCSTGRVDQQTKAEANTPLYCEQGYDCETKWHEAINFITVHSGFRLKKVTEQYAQTMGPNGSSGIATTLRKQPLEPKLYRIAIAVDCGRNFVEKSVCSQDRVVQYVAALKRAVNRSLPRDSAGTQKRSHKDLRTVDIGPSPNTIGDSLSHWNSTGSLPLTIVH